MTPRKLFLKKVGRYVVLCLGIIVFSFIVMSIRDLILDIVKVLLFLLLLLFTPYSTFLFLQQLYEDAVRESMLHSICNSNFDNNAAETHWGNQMIWLRKHASQYRGNWVAVRDGHLVAAAATLEELETAIGQTSSLDSMLVTKVL